MLPTLALAVLAQGQPLLHQPDTAPLIDPERPITRITPTSFTIHYYTATPAETKLQFRHDEVPMTAFARKGPVAWRQAAGSVAKTTIHSVTVGNLQPGKRYFYRVYDPGANPT